MKIGIYILETLFTCGVLGSCAVLLLSMVEDFEVFAADTHESTDDNQLGPHPDFTTT